MKLTRMQKVAPLIPVSAATAAVLGTRWIYWIAGSPWNPDAGLFVACMAVFVSLFVVLIMFLTETAEEW